MIRFGEMNEVCVPEMNGGKGITKARMYADQNIKIMLSTLEPGCSIGVHEHKTSSEIVYVLAGEAHCTLNGKEETVRAGECHYCPKGSTHSLENRGTTPLLLFDAVPEIG